MILEPAARTSPVSWPVIALGDIAEVKLGKMLDKAKHQTGRKFPYLRNVNVRWGTVATDDVFEMHFEDDQVDRFSLRAGDVLVCEGGEPGRAAVWNGHVAEMKFQKAIHRVRFNVPYEARLLVYLLESLAKSGGLERRFTGSTIKHFTREAFIQLPIPFPPLPEQRRIVAEIEKQFTRLEAGVTALRRVQANLKRYRAAVLKAACEGRLVPTEAEIAKTGNRKAIFETGEALLARILTERQHWFDRQQANAKTKKKYIEPDKPDTANLSSLPDGWTWGTWNQLSNWVTYGFTRPMPHVETGIPIVTAKGVNKGRIDFDGAHLTPRESYEKLSEKDRPRPGDLLITKDGTIGRAAVVDTDREFCINQSVAVVWLRSCPMERKFLLTVIESELTQKPIWAKARGVAIQHLSITDFAKMALPIPPLAEQTRIVAEVERRLSVVEEVEAVVSANLQRASRLRQSILSKAFTGELCR
ncbi:MAG: restriction endonuclease subunit S [Chthoniobacteraceae bacterium]